MLEAATADGKTSKVKRHSEFFVVARRLSQNSSAVIGCVVAVVLVIDITAVLHLLAPDVHVAGSDPHQGASSIERPL